MQRAATSNLFRCDRVGGAGLLRQAPVRPSAHAHPLSQAVSEGSNAALDKARFNLESLQVRARGRGEEWLDAPSLTFNRRPLAHDLHVAGRV